MKNINKLIMLTVALATLVVGFTGCAKKTEETNNTDSSKKTVKIAYLPITHAVPLYVESEDAIINSETLKNVNVELVKFGSWPELMDALNTGKVDGASVLIELAMKSKEQGIDLKTVALGHRDGNNVTVSNDINSAVDLKGKTVAIPQRFSTQNILLYEALQNAGLKYEDVNVIEMPPAEMPAALSEGRISGYVVAEPFGAKAVSSGKAKTLFTSQDLWKDSICCGLVLRGDFIKNNPEAVQELVNGYVKAGNAAEAKDENIKNITSKFMAVDRNILDISFNTTTYTDLKINEKDYDQLTTYLKTMGLLNNSPAFNDFVDNSFIDKAE